LAQIHPEVLSKLEKRLGVGPAQVYRQVARKAAATHLPRHLAALALAADKGINISKRSYATDEERAQLRGAIPLALTTPSAAAAPASPTAARPSRRRTDPQRRGARKSNRVLVVHGRDLAVRDAMFDFLRSLALQPIEWSAAVKETKKAAPYVGEVVTTMFRQAAAVVVLLTPDDEARLRRGYLKPSDPRHERELTGQPRANVIFEAGRAFGSHPDATILVQVGEVRPFSDTAGVHVVHLADTAECRRDLANRLEAAGCAVSLDGTDWLSAGDFSARPARRRKRGEALNRPQHAPVVGTSRRR